HRLVERAIRRRARRQAATDAAGARAVGVGVTDIGIELGVAAGRLAGDESQAHDPRVAVQKDSPCATAAPLDGVKTAARVWPRLGRATHTTPATSAAPPTASSATPAA